MAVFDVKPWPRFPHIRTITLTADGCLLCECGGFESTLAPCIHAIAVKRGQLSLSDFHFRHYIEWQSGHIPLSCCPRTFGDGAAGPTSLGVDMSSSIVEGFDQDHLFQMLSTKHMLFGFFYQYMPATNLLDQQNLCLDFLYKSQYNSPQLGLDCKVVQQKH